MQLQLTLVGRTPLLMHNVRLADPDDPISKAISQLTKKRNKTEEDRNEVARLEWYGGIYADENGPYIPTANVRRCFAQAGAATRQKTSIIRSVHPLQLSVPLEYDGPRALDDLWATSGFQNRAMIGVQGSKVARVRPQFSDWLLTLDVELITETLDQDDFLRIAKAAGRIEGLGDNRVNGYGRFDIEARAVV